MALDIEILDFIGIWCMKFEISEYINTSDIISKEVLSNGYSAVKLHMSTQVMSNPEVP